MGPSSLNLFLKTMSKHGAPFSKLVQLNRSTPTNQINMQIAYRHWFLQKRLPPGKIVTPCVIVILHCKLFTSETTSN